MKTRNTLIALCLGFLTFGFIGKSNEYKVNTQDSKINWVGRKVAGEHTGTIRLSSGKLFWDGQNIKGGSFAMDMTSIRNTDLTDPEYNQKLVGHLKADDFFGSDKFPKATFVITKVIPGKSNQTQVIGNLTIKGITQEIQSPVTVQEKGNQVQAKATILVDRTKYGIKYGSGSFFDNLGDKAIDNQFQLDVTLVAENTTVAKAS